ncbi:aminotransferase class V-fold PLP-dependent enzyme [uncultured Algimonas sp.]|uniref:aminotransferase class V-fold PLP-dependent enzyme n=1 Tax=uncultured Algimonas sp. TaxID=1547920 RepID=UPI0026053A9D|nr:aminotransferase class V-fold PLP-dependent enzyme [uncultured Algimonas sp.]
MLTTLDLERLRADTPACEQIVHFNNAGASLMPQPVYAAMIEHLAREQAVGGYEAQADAAEAIADFYAAFADMLNCDPLEVAFMESATKAWDAAFYSLPLVPGDRVLVHSSTYSSNYLALLQLARRKGLSIDFAPSDEDGQIDVAALPGLVRDRTKLILLTHCPSQSGLIQPAKAVGRFAREYDLLYLLDACQSAGQMPLDVDALQCDALTGTGRKFLRGPRGTGFLYMRRELAERVDPVFVDLQSAMLEGPDHYSLAPGARRFESWERNVAGQIALGRAVRYAMDVGLDAIAARIQPMAERLREGLSDLPGVTVHDPGSNRSAIVTFSKSGVDVGNAKARLNGRAINVSTVPREWALLDAQERNLPDLIRASLHAYNNAAETDRLLEAVGAL